MTIKTNEIYEALFEVMNKARSGKQDIEQGRLILHSATRTTELFQAELRQQKLQMDMGAEITGIADTDLSGSK